MEKRIETYWSTANQKNTIACVFIEPKNLSPENIRFAKEKLGYEGNDLERVLLELPITTDTPAEEVEQFFVDLAQQFADQEERTT